jgi:hypothetical protein
MLASSSLMGGSKAIDDSGIYPTVARLRQLRNHQRTSVRKQLLGCSLTDSKPQLLKTSLTLACLKARRCQSLAGSSSQRLATWAKLHLLFDFLSTRTYNEKGAKTVWLKESRSSWDKQQCTLQVCVSADRVPRCQPLLIFHGAAEKGDS